MKKFIIAVTCAACLYFLWDYAHYQLGVYVELDPEAEVTSFMDTDEETIYMERDGVRAPFEIRGVNMGAGLPGKWATDYAIDEETYLRWFAWIQEMGANTIRVYTILQDDFYNAFYQYNQGNDHPLYLIHGVWVNDYVQNSHRDAYDADFRGAFIRDCRTVVDVLHGQRRLSLGRGLGTGSYRKDVSPWVIGYILGVEWEDVTVEYTNHKYPERDHYAGDYLYTTEDASPFEALLCEVGDRLIAYESHRYKEQRLVAFSNWPTTDPFEYPEDITEFFMKCAQVDVEHIRATQQFAPGQFASYHVYPYYPDYLAYEKDKSGFAYKDGKPDTYLTYLKRLTAHHRMPVVISEYGVSSGRGMAQRELGLGRNQGHMSEQEQGEAIISCYEDIRAAGCAGSCVFTWQDEWFKRTWNTMHAVDLQKTPYWSDYQTNEQYFGLLSFDPGSKRSICYVDGDREEWTDADRVAEGEEGFALSMKYDEKFLYFLVERQGYDFAGQRFFLPIDTTQKTGSRLCENYGIGFDRACDFLLVFDGKQNSRLLVQERYEVLRAMFSRETRGEDGFIDPPKKDSARFRPVDLILQTATPLLSGRKDADSEVYETGKLAYGDANPEHGEAFDSLADFCYGDGFLELRLPWQLLNFADPSNMQIHDDYYEHYGVEYLPIRKLYVGIGTGEQEPIRLEAFPLKGWGKKVTFHERRKASYYALKAYWTGTGGDDGED